MPKETAHMIYEADIGSGEKSLGEQETQRQIEQIPAPELSNGDQVSEHSSEGKPASGKPPDWHGSL